MQVGSSLSHASPFVDSARKKRTLSRAPTLFRGGIPATERDQLVATQSASCEFGLRRENHRIIRNATNFYDKTSAVDAHRGGKS